MILSKIGKYSENSMALIEIDYLKDSANGKFDAKELLRKAFNSIGMLNQFITTKDREEEIFENKVRSSMLDLFNDIGFTNGYFNIKDKVIYSFYCNKKKNKIKGTDKFIDSIPFIIRMDNYNIEFMALEGHNPYEWIPLMAANKFLDNLSSWLKINLIEEQLTDEEIIKEIFTEINCDERDKLLIVSEENNLDNKFVVKYLELLNNTTVVETSIVETELVQIHKDEGHTGITKCIYKIDDNHYRSVGEKVIGMKQKATYLKGSEIKNEYKHRRLFDIKILKKNMNEDLVAELVHRLRSPITTKVHINSDILTEHLKSFEKNLNRGENNGTK